MSAPAMPATDYQVLWDTIHSLVDEQKKRIDALEEEVRGLRAQLQQQQQQQQQYQQQQQRIGALEKEANLPLRVRPAEVQEDATSAPPASVEADMAESSADPAPATSTSTSTSTEVAVVPAAAAERRCFVCGSLDHIKKNCPKRRRAEPGHGGHGGQWGQYAFSRGGQKIYNNNYYNEGPAPRR
ncbi:hypothetical protein V8C43DRAFT_302201 [Trichoderma afarasin]